MNSRTIEESACRGRCLPSPSLANRINRIVVLGTTLSVSTLVMTAAGVPAVTAAGVELAFMFGVNLALLAFDLHQRQVDNADAWMQAEVRQQANNALIRMAVLGRTALDGVFRQAGDANAVQRAAELTARAAFARQNGNEVQPEPGQDFIDQMDMILDRV